jgi:energy-coupling factor transport system permease protein
VHPITWVVWTGLVAAIAIVTRNPLYLSLLLGVVIVHYVSVSQPRPAVSQRPDVVYRPDALNRPDAQGWRMLLRVALWMALLVIPLNALSIHAGSHVLFRLPARWPLVGGAITLEGIAAGVVSALGLLALIALFATFNLRISQAQLLRLTPAFVYEAGLIVSIALAFVPQMLVSGREIHEAQLVRGHRMRRARDMLPYLMALLTTGLERSFQLAESMEARGFGNARSLPRGRELLFKGLTLLGLAGFLCGVFLQTYFESLRAPGWTIVAVSAALLLGVFWAQGRRVLRVRYRQERWTWRDGVVLALCAAVVALLAWVRLQDATAFAYSSYDELLPPFDPAIGIALILLVAPVMVGADEGWGTKGEGRPTKDDRRRTNGARTERGMTNDV